MSRLALAAVAAVAASAAWSALSPASTGGVLAAATGPLQVPAGGTDEGSTIADLVSGVESAVRDAAGELVSLEVGRPDDRRVAVRIVVDVTAEPTGIARVLSALEDHALVAPMVEAVVATPAGSRTDVTAHVLLSDRRITGGPDGEPGRPLAVALAEDVARAAVRLRRLDVEDVDGALVRLEIEGPVDSVVRLLATIERRYAAPTRFLALTTRRSEDRALVVSMVFRPRPERR